MNILIFLGIFLLLIAFNFSIAFALGITIAAVMIMTGTPVGLIPMRLWSGLDKFAWVAIPFFILAGELMTRAGILERLLDFARLLVGRFRGGLLHINILVSMLFGGINGSAVADASAVGSMLIPTTVKEYGDAPFVAAVTACSSMVGPLIPPSLPFILYALTAQNVTISGMFMAGVVPGILLGLGMMGVTHLVTRNKHYPKDTTRYAVSDVVRITRRFIIALFLPVIMVGGVVSGVFTATESSNIAVLYALFVGIFVTRKLNFSRIFDAIIHAAKLTSIVLILVGFANVAVWWLTTQRLPFYLTTFIQSLTDNPYMLLFLLSMMFLILGVFIDSAALIVMLVPVTTPICVKFGINPLHIGLVTTYSIMLGLITPPVAMALFISGTIAKVPIERVFRASLPLFGVCVGVLVLITFFEEIWIWVPALIGYLE